MLTAQILAPDPLFDLPNKQDSITNCGTQDLPTVVRLDKNWLQNLGRRPDIAILCGGSKDDVPAQGPFFVRDVHTVDSYDDHGKAEVFTDDKGNPCVGYYAAMDAMAQSYGHVAAIGMGWHPGIFSAMDALFSAVTGSHATIFYGCEGGGGLSMGHTNALRQVPGVVDAAQFTVANHDVLDKLRLGKYSGLTRCSLHRRMCYIHADPEADQEEILKIITSMPGYFLGYETDVKFVSAEELWTIRESHGRRHDGKVIAHSHLGLMEFSMSLRSNPDMTAAIMLTAARAVIRRANVGVCGAFTFPQFAPEEFLPPDSGHLNFF